MCYIWQKWYVHEYTLSHVNGGGENPVTSSLPSQRITRILIFCLILALTDGWTNIRIAGNLRRTDTHFDVNVMTYRIRSWWWLPWMVGQHQVYHRSDYMAFCMRRVDRVIVYYWWTCLITFSLHSYLYNQFKPWKVRTNTDISRITKQIFMATSSCSWFDRFSKNN